MKLHGTAGDILKHKGHSAWSLAPEASVYDAIELMADKHIGAVLILSGDQMVGLVSERDYARKVILKGRSSRETRVWEIMSTAIVSVGLQHTVDDCMKLMTEHRIRHLPVVDHDRLVGVVSIGDLVSWIMSAQDHTIEHLENYISGRYPA